MLVSLVNVTDAIGQALEQECQMQYYERVCPWFTQDHQRQLLAPCMWYTTETCCCSYSHQPQRCNALEDVEA